MQALCAALFPSYARLVLQRLSEVVQRGAERYQQAAIACMRAIFQASRNAAAGGVLCRGVVCCVVWGRCSRTVSCPTRPAVFHTQWPFSDSVQVPGLDLGPSGWPANDPHFTQQLSAHLSGPLSGAVLETFKALLAFQGSGGGRSQEAAAADAAAAGHAEAEAEPLEWQHCMDDLGGSNKLCSEALERVMRACPGSAQLLWGSGGGGSGAGGGGHMHQASAFLPFLS